MREPFRRREGIRPPLACVAPAVLAVVAFASACGAERRCRAILPRNATQIVRVAQCEQIEPRWVDLVGILQGRGSCSLPSGVVARQSMENEETLDHSIQIVGSEGQVLRTIQPPDPCGFRPTNYGVSPTIGCSSRRLYYVHPILGRLYAFDLDGKLLWSRNLEGFRKLDDRLKEADASELFGELDSSASIAVQAVPAGNRVAVEFRTGGMGTYHAIFDEDGWPVATLGPWSAVMTEPTGDGWSVLAGRTVDYAMIQADRRLQIAIRVPPAHGARSGPGETGAGGGAPP